MKRRQTLALGAALSLPPLLAQAQPAGTANGSAAPRVLRYAFQIAETGFDPAQIVDTYSRSVTCHIFEALYVFDHLARPAKIVPLTADGTALGVAPFTLMTTLLGVRAAAWLDTHPVATWPWDQLWPFLIAAAVLAATLGVVILRKWRAQAVE